MAADFFSKFGFKISVKQLKNCCTKVKSRYKECLSKFRATGNNIDEDVDDPDGENMFVKFKEGLDFQEFSWLPSYWETALSVFCVREGLSGVVLGQSEGEARNELQVVLGEPERLVMKEKSDSDSSETISSESSCEEEMEGSTPILTLDKKKRNSNSFTKGKKKPSPSLYTSSGSKKEVYATIFERGFDKVVQALNCGVSASSISDSDKSPLASLEDLVNQTEKLMELKSKIGALEDSNAPKELVDCLIMQVSIVEKNILSKICE